MVGDFCIFMGNANSLEAEIYFRSLNQRLEA